MRLEVMSTCEPEGAPVNLAWIWREVEDRVGVKRLLSAWAWQVHWPWQSCWDWVRSKLRNILSESFLRFRICNVWTTCVSLDWDEKNVGRFGASKQNLVLILNVRFNGYGKSQMQMTGTKACSRVSCPELDGVLHSCAMLEGIRGIRIFYPFHIHCSWNLCGFNTVPEQKKKRQSQCRLFWGEWLGKNRSCY